MMKNAKMNEKGKLLAIIAVFAMVFAGAAVVMSSEGVDATTPSAYAPVAVTDATELPTSIAAAADVPESKTYYAAKNTTTTLSYATETPITVYVKSGVSVEFKGATGNQVTVTVIGYYEGDAGAKFYNGAGTGTSEGAADTKIVINPLVADENIKVTPTTVAGKNTTMQISGTATTTATLLAITLGNVVSADTGTPAVTVKGTLTLKGNAAPANLTYAYSLYKATPGTIAINEKPLKTYNHAADTDTADVLTIAGYEGLKVTADIKVTSDKGATTFQLVDALLTADLTVSMKKTTEPAIAGGTPADAEGLGTVVTLFQGFATAKAATAEDGFKGTFNAVEDTVTPTHFNAQFYYKAGDNTATPAVPDQKYTKVVGTVTQKSTINLVAAAGAITGGVSSTLIIPAGVEVIVNSATVSTLEGTVELYGALVAKGAGAAESSMKTLKIGPYGYTNFGVDGDTFNISYNGEQPEIGSVIFEYTEIGSVVLNSDVIIRESGTLVANQDFGLNGYTITVYGTLIIKGSLFTTALDKDGVTINDNVLTIGSTGKVDIQGEIAVNTYVGIILDSETDHVDLKVRGVDGLVYSPAEYENTTVPAICGDIVPNNASYKDVESEVILGDTKTLIPLPLVISSGVTLDVGAGEIVAGGLAAISLEGTLKGGENSALILNSLSSIAINGIVDTIAIKAYQGDIAATTTNPNTTFAFTVGNTAGTEATDTAPAVPSKKTYVAGLTITVTPFVVSKTLTEQRVYIEGELTVGTSTEDYTPLSTVAHAPSVALTGANVDVDMIYIEEDDKLTLPANATLGFGANGLTFVVEGVIERTTDALGSPYIGGHYVLKTAVQSATITTHVYENYVKAIAVIGSTDGKTVDVCVKEIGSSFTIVEGEKVNLLRNDTVIKSDATVTFESSSSMTGTVDTVNGILKVMNGARVNEPIHYTSKITTETDDVIYAGADGANALAQPGDEIIMGDGEAKGDFTFKAGVKYRLQGTLQVPGNVSVEEGSDVVFEGGEIAFKGGKTHNLEVAGDMDASQGSFSKATDKDKITTSVTPTGELTVISEEVIDELGFNGASYETMNGFVMTTIDSAIPGAIAAALDYIVKIHGNVVYVADITVEKVTIVFKTDATLNFAGTVTLDDATIDVTGGTFTGIVTTNTLLFGSATAEFTAVKGTLKIADDKSLTLSGNLTSGIVSLDAGTTIFGDLIMGDALIMVGERAAAHVHGETSITDGVFVIAGSVVVDNGGLLTLAGGKNSVSATGTLVAQKTESAGTIAIKTLAVLGTLENKGGYISVTENLGAETGLIIGEEPSSLGAANGTVIGNITAGTNIIMIYAGADVDEMTIDDAANYKGTVFIINGVEYQIMASSNPTGITNEILAASDYDLPGYEGTAALKTIGGWDFGVTDPKVGNPAIVTATLEKSTVDVTVSPIKGMSIVVDGVTYKNTVEADLKVGEHTLAFTLDPGYKIKDGSSVTLTFNGVKVTNAIIITPDMVGQDLILAASGDIVIDQEIPEQEKQDDTIIIILLAILVVMVVILAIVTILRMMRS